MSHITISEWDHNFWFYPSPEKDGTWVVSYIRSGDFYCNYNGDDTTVDPEVADAFKEFIDRPEHVLYAAVQHQIYLPEVMTSDEALRLKTLYEQLISGAILLRYMKTYKDPNGAIKRVYALLDWLEGNKFYEAPASSVYHESYRGGLLLHTLKVFNLMNQLSDLSFFCHIDAESIALASLPHDWCKIGLYHPYMRNVKNEQTGQWEQREAYKRELTGIPMGHGEASLYYIQKFINLTDDEALAIRWHMSVWNCCDAEYDELQASNEKYPLVHMLQFADQLSITNYACHVKESSYE